MPRRSTTASLIAMLALLVAGSASHPATAQAGGGCRVPDGSGYTEGPATVVRMDVCSFQPTVVRVPVGTTVRFLNTAPNEHAVAGRSQTWASDVLASGAEFSERFDAAGIYPFACPLHPGMVGAVIVGAAAAAVSGNEPVAAPVSATEQAPAAPSDPTPVSPGDASPIAAGVVAGLVGGAIIGLLGSGLVAGRRRSASTSTSTDRARSSVIDG